MSYPARAEGLVNSTLWPINSGVLTSLLLPHLSQTPCLPWISYATQKNDAWFMQDAPKAVWSIPYVSLAFFHSLKHNFITYHSSKVSDCIFEIHQLWQSGFSKVYSNYCCSCSFEAEIMRIGQSSHKMYSNKILNFQESTTMLIAHTKKVWKLIVCSSWIYIIVISRSARHYVNLYKLLSTFTSSWCELIISSFCLCFWQRSLKPCNTWFGWLGFMAYQPL